MALFFLALCFIMLFSYLSDREWGASLIWAILVGLNLWWLIVSINYVQQKTVVVKEIPIYSISTDKNFQLGFSQDVYKFYIKDNSGGYIVYTIPLSSVLYMSDDTEPHIETITTTYSEKPLFFDIGSLPFIRDNYNSVEYKIYVPSNTIKLNFDSGG